MVDHPYRGPVLPSAPRPSWPRRLVALLPLPTRWRWARATLGGHWERPLYLASGPVLDKAWRLPWRRRECCHIEIEPPIFSDLTVLCEDYGPEVPTMRWLGKLAILAGLVLGVAAIAMAQAWTLLHFGVWAAWLGGPSGLLGWILTRYCVGRLRIDS